MNATTTSEIKVGDRCVTQTYGKVKGTAAQYPYFQPAIYEVAQLKSGSLVWKYVNHIGTARRSVLLAIEDAKAYAAEIGCQYIPEVRQWKAIVEESR